MAFPKSSLDLISDDKQSYAFLATVMADGSPQVTPVWFDIEGDLIRINTVRGRIKDRNLASRPHAALAIMNLDNPFRYLQIRGKVVNSTEEGAKDHIDRLARKYTDEETWSGASGEIRVIHYIEPESFDYSE